MPFEAEVAPHSGLLLAYCRSLARCKWDAEDLYQETLIRTFMYMRTYGQPRHIRAFLHRTARNAWIDEYRRRRGLSQPAVEREHEQLGYVHVRVAVETMAERLDVAQIELVLLAGHYGYSMPDIASMTGRTVAAVKCGLHRARRALRADGSPNRRRGSASGDGGDGGGEVGTHPRGWSSDCRSREIDYWSGQLLYHRPYRAYKAASREAGSS